MTNVSPRDLSLPSSFYIRIVSFRFLFSPHLFLVLSLSLSRSLTHSRALFRSSRPFPRFLPPEYPSPILATVATHSSRPSRSLFVVASTVLYWNADRYRGVLYNTSIKAGYTRKREKERERETNARGCSRGRDKHAEMREKLIKGAAGFVNLQYEIYTKYKRHKYFHP